MSLEKFVPGLGWSWLTVIYDPATAAMTREKRFKRQLIDQADIKPGARILDLGSGTGTLAVRIKLAVPRANVTGVDADPRMVAAARRKAGRCQVEARFDVAYSHALPYEIDSFDRVVSTLFFHHLDLDAKRRTLAEAMRVLKPAGELHVVDWGLPSGTLAKLLFFPVRLVDGFENTRDNVTGNLVALFVEAGFRDVAVRGGLETMFGTLSFYFARKPF